MFFGHTTIKERINDIHKEIGNLTHPDYNDQAKREQLVKDIRFKVLALIKTDEKISALIAEVLKEMDDKYKKV